MNFWPFSAKNEAESTSDINSVNINKDGIVSLNLDDKNVQNKIFEQIKKLKTYEDELRRS